MTPEFDDLVGDDLDPAERARLERVHDLLVAAGPPPEPAARVVPLRPHRRRGALLALAAALAVAAFAIGAAVGNHTAGRSVDFVVTMEGTATAPAASASLAVFEADAAGNWPMRMTVSGLDPRGSGKPFELWLTRDGKLAALCGTFLTSDEGRASVPMTAPYDFDEFDGWVVVVEGTKTPLLTT
jgi:Anti-sigma-K factor rskA